MLNEKSDEKKKYTHERLANELNTSNKKKYYYTFVLLLFVLINKFRLSSFFRTFFIHQM